MGTLRRHHMQRGTWSSASEISIARKQCREESDIQGNARRTREKRTGTKIQEGDGERRGVETKCDYYTAEQKRIEADNPSSQRTTRGISTAQDHECFATKHEIQQQKQPGSIEMSSLALEVLLLAAHQPLLVPIQRKNRKRKNITSPHQ